MSLYSVVVPVYNSEHTLEELYRRLEKVFREVIKEDFELILVDDGSKDRSFAVGSFVVSFCIARPGLLIMSANFVSVLPAHWMISKEIPDTTGTIRRRPKRRTQ